MTSTGVTVYMRIFFSEQMATSLVPSCETAMSFTRIPDLQPTITEQYGAV